MKFYWYDQTNSGGSFHFDEDNGITNHVIIEAENMESANDKFFEIGGYFNGIDDDIDCECCGAQLV